MTFSRPVVLLGCTALLAVALGCPKKDAPPPADPTPTPGPATTPAASQPADEDPLAVSPEDAKQPSCLKPFKATGDDADLTIAGQAFRRAGDVLTSKTADADDVYTFGQITDVKEDTPENLGNVKRLLQWLIAEKADALVVTGDLGESQPSIESVMRALAQFPGPVLLMIGNREGLTDFTKAFDAVSPEHSNLVNMNQIRVYNADDASLISLPGYFNPAYIHSQDGCRYTPEDVSALTTLMSLASSTAVLASHGPPRQESSTGIDRIHEGVNVGDPVLAKFLTTNKIHFGMFGNIHEAGGKATDLTGKEEIRADTYVSELYLNPGPADAVRWPLLDGTESIGMAGLLRIKGKQAMYKVHRLRPGEAAPAEKAPAKEPAPETP
ncbi:MAG: metallophosphoesterase [Pseudomonadota bacterium]